MIIWVFILCVGIEVSQCQDDNIDNLSQTGEQNEKIFLRAKPTDYLGPVEFLNNISRPHSSSVIDLMNVVTTKDIRSSMLEIFCVSFN